MTKTLKSAIIIGHAHLGILAYLELDESQTIQKEAIVQEYRFTLSMTTAIDFALRLAQGKLQNDNPMLNFPQPIWTNFCFFERISAGNMERIERLKDETGYEWGWKVQRMVKFYHRDKCVIEMRVEGEKWDKNRCQGIKPDRLAGWAVVWFRYAEYFDGNEHPIYYKEANLPASGNWTQWA